MPDTAGLASGKGVAGPWPAEYRGLGTEYSLAPFTARQDGAPDLRAPRGTGQAVGRLEYGTRATDQPGIFAASDDISFLHILGRFPEMPLLNIV